MKLAPRSVLYAHPKMVQGFAEPSLALLPQVMPVKLVAEAQKTSVAACSGLQALDAMKFCVPEVV